MSHVDPNATITVGITLQGPGELARYQRFLEDIYYSRSGHLPAALAGSQPKSKVKAPVSLGTLPFDEPKEPNAASPIADVLPDVVRLFTSYVERKGREEARKLLDAFHAPFLKDVRAEQLPAFLAELSR